MAKANRKFIPGYTYYVPRMQAGGDLGQAVNGRFSLGAPIVAAAASILSAQSIAAAVDTTTFVTTWLNTEAQMGRFGRCLQVIASGAAVSNVTIYGRDYLGQKMAESFTLAGAVAVIGKKAFRYVDRITAGITGGTTINVGHTDLLGLPYVTMKVVSEYADNVAQAAGTFAAPIFTDPQTLTTGDPRGTYDPTAVLNGTKIIEVDLELSYFENAAGNGGLHGIQHVAA